MMLAVAGDTECLLWEVSIFSSFLTLVGEESGVDERVKIIGNAILLLETMSEACSARPGSPQSAFDIDDIIVEISTMSEPELDKLREKVQQYVCSNRSAQSHLKYYEFYNISPTCVTFNSKWIGDTADGESRVLRAVDACRISYARSKDVSPIYLLITEDEVELWANIWRGKAFLTKQMVEYYFPTMLKPS
jgi:hypothetical protein